MERHASAAVLPRTPVLAALTAVALLLLSAVASAPAWAHDTLIGSSPEADEVLTSSPEEVRLEFSGDGLTTGESIPNIIWVTDAEGEHWEAETQVEGSSMWTELPESLPNGEYEVLYNAVYSDGHSEEAGFSFEVDDPQAEPSPAEDAQGQGTQPEETPAAEDPDAAETAEATAGEDQTAAEETAAAQPQADEQAAADGGSAPMWTAVLVGAGLLVLLAAVMIWMRRRGRSDN